MPPTSDGEDITLIEKVSPICIYLKEFKVKVELNNMRMSTIKDKLVEVSIGVKRIKITQG
jgi:hypothetical protein